MLEAELVGDLAHCQVGRGELFLGLFYQLVMYMLLGTLSCQCFEQAAEVVGSFYVVVGVS